MGYLFSFSNNCVRRRCITYFIGWATTVFASASLKNIDKSRKAEIQTSHPQSSYSAPICRVPRLWRSTAARMQGTAVRAHCHCLHPEPCRVLIQLCELATLHCREVERATSSQRPFALSFPSSAICPVPTSTPLHSKPHSQLQHPISSAMDPNYEKQHGKRFVVVSPPVSSLTHHHRHPNPNLHSPSDDHTSTNDIPTATSSA